MIKKKKILFAINDIRAGGAEGMVLEQIGAIDKEKFEPYLLTLYEKGAKHFFEIPLADARRFHFKFHNLLDYRLWSEVFKLLRRERFDVVISNLFDANFSVRILSLIAGVPLIFSYEHNVSPEKRLWQRIADSILARFTKKIFVGSATVRTFTATQELIPESKFYVNYNSARSKFSDIKKSRSAVLARHGLPENALYVVTAGRLIEQKGHRYLIEAARELVKQSSSVYFLIFGKGELEETLGKAIKEQGLTGRVVLKGMAPMEEILAMSDIFTLPSLWEGLSVALIQAMDAGCPIVGTRISGTDEAIENGVDGLLVTPASAKELQDALAKLIENENLRESLGRRAREKFSAAFSIERNVKRIEGVIMGF